MFGQMNADYGVLGGTTYYIGDINPVTMFKSPMPAGGIFYRFNFNPRQSLRLHLLAGGLVADETSSNNSFQTNRGANFSGMVTELAAQFEFNFLPYSTEGKKFDYTPYFAAGAGLAFISTSAASTYVPVIPFSVGFRINVGKNLGVEAEYGFRKTFYDNFDGLNDPVSPADVSSVHNNDWYSFAGVAFTWKIISRLAGCPAYADVENSKRRR